MKVNSHIMSGIVIIFLGVIASLSILVIHRDYYKVYPNLVEGECIIEDIDVEEYKTTISYEVNKETIKKKLNLYDSSFKVGLKTKIYYDEREPLTSYLQSEVTFYNMSLALGLIIIITGIYFIINYFIKKNHYNDLKKDGKKIKAQIVSVDHKKFMSWIPFHPCTICARAKIDHTEYNFLSETIYYRSSKYLKDHNVKNIDVYINKEEIGDYYVDISFIHPGM